MGQLATAAKGAAMRVRGDRDGSWMAGSKYLQGLRVPEDEAWQDFFDYRAKKAAAAAPPQQAGGFPGGFPGLGGMGGLGGLQSLLAGLGRGR